MKKIKSLLLVCMAALMMLAIPLAAACKTDDFKGLTLESIELNIDNAKIAYIVGEEYTSDGVEVIATLKNKKGETETRDLTEYSTFDSSAFNGNAAGQYTITVVCTVNGVSKDSSYDVSVLNDISDAREGLLVTHSDGTRIKTINIDANTPTVSIDPSEIVVQSVEFGEVKGEISDYTVKVYKESQEITNYTGLGSGTYQIWVSKPSAISSGYVLEDFVLIYVVENVISFKWVGGTTTQNIGIDIMTPTWTYQVTYATSSTPVTLTAADVSVTGIDVFTTGNKTARATYVYYKADGEMKTLTVTVKYTVVPGSNQVDEHAFNYDDIKNKGYADNTPLTQEDFNSANNEFLTKLPAGIVDFRTTDSCINIRGDALQVTFKGVGTLTVSARSQGDNNLSSIGLKREVEENVFEYIPGKFSSGYVQRLDYIEGPMYQVTGKFSDIEFTISEAGTYILFTNDETPEGDATYERATRVVKIEMKDIYENATTTGVANGTSIVKAVGKLSEINLYNNGSKD